MDEEIKSLLEKNLEISEQTLSLLKKIRREVVWARILHVIKWIIIIGLLIFGFVKIQPYLAYWAGIFIGVATGIEKLNSFFPR